MSAYLTSCATTGDRTAAADSAERSGSCFGVIGSICGTAAVGATSLAFVSSGLATLEAAATAAAARNAPHMSARSDSVVFEIVPPVLGVLFGSLSPSVDVGWMVDAGLAVFFMPEYLMRGCDTLRRLFKCDAFASRNGSMAG